MLGGYYKKKNPRYGREFSYGIMARGMQSSRVPYE